MPWFDKSISIVRNNLLIENKKSRRHSSGADNVNLRIAKRLAGLRAERGFTLDALAKNTGLSRATLSRLERGELSPTATMMNSLCSQYGWTASQLMAEAEAAPSTMVRAKEQLKWKDPETGYVRRVVSPPHERLKGELVEIELPAGKIVSYPVSPVPRLEHHLWMLDGALTLEIEGSKFQLQKGDCIRYVLSGPSRFVNASKHGARYVIALIHP